MGDPLFLCSQEYLRKSFLLFVYVSLEQLLPVLLCEAAPQTCPISIVPHPESPGGVLKVILVIRAAGRILEGTLNLMWKEICHYGIEEVSSLMGGEGDVIF